MSSTFAHQRFESYFRVSLPLSNDRCQNILYKAIFEHFIELKWIAALLLTSKSFQNSSFGANFLVNFVVRNESIDLLHSVLAPSSCFSMQFVPSLYISGWYLNPEKNQRIFNFVGEIAKTKYLHLSLRSLTLEDVARQVTSFFFGSSSNSWSQLQVLNLKNGGVDDTVLENISIHALQLRTVNLHFNPEITDAGLEHLANLSRITFLDLSDCNKITDLGLEHLSKLSCITSLDLKGYKKITDAGLEHLSNLRSITSLNVAGCNAITDAGLESLSKLVGITSLDLRNCCEITDVGLEHLSKLSSLAKLDLNRCFNITESGVVYHLSKLSSLTMLDLYDCELRTVDVNELKAALPNCHILIQDDERRRYRASSDDDSE